MGRNWFIRLMSGWQQIGVAMSIGWLIGLLIVLVLRSTWKTVGSIYAGNSDILTLWIMMLGPVVLLWLIGIIILDAVRRIRMATVNNTSPEYE